MQPHDWTLLTIAAGREQPVYPSQLQKALFVLDRKLSHAERQVTTFYDFVPHDYGPFCSTIGSDAAVLGQAGLVQIEQPLGQSYRQYRATAAGQARVHELRALLTPKVLRYLDTVVSWVLALSFPQLIAAIAKAYPDMQTNRVFKHG